MDVKGIILAAGRGSRLKEKTDHKPKCLVDVSGKPMLSWQLDALKGAGLTDITLVGGYKSDMLTPFGCPMRINERWHETNMVASLLCAEDLLVQSAAIVSYSDILYPPDHVSALLGCDDDIALTYDAQWHLLWSRRFKDPLSDAETFVLDEQGYISEIGAKTKDIKRINGQFMGLMKFTPKGWRQVDGILDELKQGHNGIDHMDMTALMMALVRSGVRVQGVKVYGRWCECDSQSDIALYETMIETSTQKDRWSHDWR